MSNNRNLSPLGRLKLIEADGSDLVAKGWAFDPDVSSESIEVDFFLDRPFGDGGLYIGTVRTDIEDPAVNHEYGITGKHGFAWRIPAAYKGKHQLYANAIDQPRRNDAPNPRLVGTPQAFAYPYAVPAPTVVDNPNYHDVFTHTFGTYYMPKPSRPSHQWLEVKLDNELLEIRRRNGQREPLLGYYQGDSPEVLDWQIKWAIDHNVRAFVFVDYWVDGTFRPTYETSMQGFLQAQYRLHMQFAVRLELNQTVAADVETKQRRFFNVILPYYILHYLGQPNYLIVEGRPLIVISHPEEAFGTSDPAAIQEVLGRADLFIRNHFAHKYPGAYWVSGSLISGEAGFAATWFYSILPWTWPRFDFEKLPLPGPPFDSWGRRDINGEWVPGVKYYNVHVGSTVLHADAFEAIERAGMKFITSLTIDHDTRRLFFLADPQKHLYFNGNREPEWWNLLAKVKGRIDYRSDLVPVVTRTGKGLVGVSHWNEQSESTSLEPGFSEFQLHGNGDPFMVIGAPAKLFGGGALTYDQPRPPSFLSRGFPDTRDWMKATLADWETAGTAGSSFDAAGDLLLTAGRSGREEDGIRPIVIFTAVKVPVTASGSPRRLWVYVTVRAGRLLVNHPPDEHPLLSWRSSTYADSAHRFKLVFDESERGKIFQDLASAEVEQDGNGLVLSFDVGSKPPGLRWEGSIQWLELRFPFAAGSIFELVIHRITLAD